MYSYVLWISTHTFFWQNQTCTIIVIEIVRWKLVNGFFWYSACFVLDEPRLTFCPVWSPYRSVESAIPNSTSLNRTQNQSRKPGFYALVSLEHVFHAIRAYPWKTTRNRAAKLTTRNRVPGIACRGRKHCNCTANYAIRDMFTRHVRIEWEGGSVIMS